MKKTIILSIMFLCLMCISYAQTAGEEYEVTVVEKCYGSALIKLRSTDSNYPGTMVGCSKDGDIWKCSCKNPTVLYLLTNNQSKAEYDVFVQYYVAPLLRVPENNQTEPTKEEIENELNKRTLSVNNIRFGPAPIEPKEKRTIQSSTVGTGFAIALLLLIITGLGFGLKFVWEYIMKKPEEDPFDDWRVKRVEKKRGRQTDEDLEAEDYLKKYVR